MPQGMDSSVSFNPILFDREDKKGKDPSTKWTKGALEEARKDNNWYRLSCWDIQKQPHQTPRNKYTYCLATSWMGNKFTSWTICLEISISDGTGTFGCSSGYPNALTTVVVVDVVIVRRPSDAILVVSSRSGWDIDISSSQLDLLLLLLLIWQKRKNAIFKNINPNCGCRWSMASIVLLRSNVHRALSPGVWR